MSYPSLFLLIMELNEAEMPHVVMGACMEVHRALGPGLTAEAYREALARELQARELEFRTEVGYDIDFNGSPIHNAVIADFLIEGKVALEVSSSETLTEGDRHHLRKVLSCSGHMTGILVNFNVRDLRSGISRVVVTDQPDIPLPRGTRPL